MKTYEEVIHEGAARLYHDEPGGRGISWHLIDVPLIAFIFEIEDVDSIYVGIREAFYEYRAKGK